MSEFIHLHNHSDFSLLDGAQSVEQIVSRAKELDMPAIALTEHGNLFSAIHFYNTAQKYDIKPIIGCELYVTEDRFKKKKDPQQKGLGNYHLVVLAKNNQGYQNIVKLSSFGYLEGFYYKPRVDKKLLRKYNQGIIALSACIHGEVQHTALHKGYERGKKIALEYADIFPDRFYLEVQNHELEEEDRWREMAKKMSDETGIPRVATNDSHYAKQEHWEAHDAHLCIGMAKDMDDPNRIKYEPPRYWIRTKEEMEELFSDDPEVLENTVKIAEQCKLEFEFDEYHLPEFPIPEEAGTDDPDVYLEKLTWQGIEERYEEITEEIKKRVSHELGVIRDMGFAGYFLIVQDFVNYAKDQDIPVGPGRGSAAGSIVCYAIGITDVDPLRFDLIFERFLNPERVTMPDIDIDFCDRRRDRVIDYLRSQYGEESICHIITFGSMKAKGVIRDVGRVLQVPLDEVDRLTDLISAGSLEESIQQEPELKEAVQMDEKHEKLFEIASLLENKHRHASTHAAGVIVAPGELTDYIPLYKQSKDDTITTQYDMSCVEQVGMLKVDFLGLRNLSVIDDTLEILSKKRGVNLDIDNIPMDDKKTFELFGKGYTVGVFQFESEGMQENLKKLQPDRIDDLIAMNALYRPGPMENIDSYINRKHGKEEIEYMHPDLEPILKDTYGIIVYQEQVMKIGSEIAGFSLGKADLMRRAMGKKKEKILKQMEKDFIDGAVENGVAQETAKEIFSLIFKFAKYGFNKSHAAAYAILAYKIGYLKAHYPVEFMAANLTSEIENSDRVAILSEELDNLDSGILPPDVNKSDVVFTPEEGMVRYGLNAIKNVGNKAAAEMVRAVNEAGPFDDFVDFVSELDFSIVNRKALESIIVSGAADSMSGNRAQKFNIIEKSIKYGRKIQEEKNTNQVSLFGNPDDREQNQEIMPKPELPDINEWQAIERLNREKELLGMYLSGHPLKKYEQEIKKLSNYNFKKSLYECNDARIKIGGILKSVSTKFDKKDRKFAFVILESLKGTVKGIVFSSVYDKYQDLLCEDNIVFIEGKIDCKTKNKSGLILIGKVEPLEGLMEKKAKRVHIRLNIDQYDNESIKRFKKIARENSGNCELVFHINDNNGNSKKVRSKSIQVSHNKDFLNKIKKNCGYNKVWVETC
jgi:DNA polymerase-3 subunit alpha